MRRFVDLHTHSTASDGAIAPRELVRLADAKRLAAVALTDHDTTAGLAEAAEEAKAHPDLRFVPGIEVSARYAPGTMHILGLGIDPAARSLRALIESLLAARDERNPRIVERLQALGYPIDMDDVLAAASGMGILPMRRGGILPPHMAHEGRATQGQDALATRTIGRVHIAEALRRKGCVKSIREAFDRLLGNNGPAYVDKDRLLPADVVRAIADSGGAAVLAHPPQLLYENRAQLERVVKNLRSAGLAAIEAYHSDHMLDQTRQYIDLARRLGLAVTGGSDFHGAAKPDAKLGRPAVPLAAIEGRLRDIVVGREAAG
jgi:hypothetical protein